MKHFTNQEINELGKIERVNLINSAERLQTGEFDRDDFRSKKTNLAIFSSVVHLGTNPPLFGFIARPTAEVPRHTYENIKETGFYTINHVHESFVEPAHYTSAKFDRETSEFAACGLTEEYLENFDAPFVKESRIKLGLRFVEEIPIKLNQTILIVGEIEHLFLPENALLESGDVDLYRAGTACISGLDGYHQVAAAVRFPFARPNNLPDFKANQETK